MKRHLLLLTALLLISAAHAQPEVYEQKGGYSLILRPVAWVENGMRLRATQVYIEKDGTLRLLPENDACSDFIGNCVYSRTEEFGEKWTEYDARGKIIHFWYSDGHEEWFSYDEDGNLVWEKWGDGRERFYEYDFHPNGKIKAVREYTNEL